MVRTVIDQSFAASKRAYPFHCASIPPAQAGILIQEIVRRDSRSVSGGSVVVRRRTAIKAEKVNGFLPVFASVQSNWYWSSTTNVNNPDNAWIVNLNNGNVNNDNKTNNNYVWPVRGGK